IGPDGTIYFTNDDGVNGWIGQLTGSTVNRHWLRVDNAPLLAGLALDRPGKLLYVAAVSAEALLVYNLGPPITSTPLVANVQLINDVVVGPDDRVYYSVQTDNQVHALTPR